MFFFSGVIKENGIINWRRKYLIQLINLGINQIAGISGSLEAQPISNKKPRAIIIQ